MVRKVTTISLDEDLLKIAKKEIPNISKFTEDCIKVFLGYNTELIDINTEMDKIREAKLKIHLLTANDKISDSISKKDKQQINTVWRGVWNLHHNNGFVDDNDIVKASNILELPTHYLREMLEFLEFECNNEDLLKIEDFDFALNMFRSFSKFNEVD